MSSYWLSGVRVKGVRLYTASAEADKPPEKIEIDEAKVRYGILSSLFGGSDMSFDVEAFGGRATGSYETHGSDRSIDVTLEDIDIGRVEPLTKILGVPLQGKLGGSISLAMPEGKASKGTGSVSLEVADVSVGDGKAKIKGALALPTVNVGAVTLSAEAHDGLLKITKLIAGGKDVDLQGDGRVSMRELATDSLCDAQIRFKINDVYRAKSDITKSLFGAPGSTAPALFELADPRIKQSKRADGFYGWAIRGPLGRPDLNSSPGRHLATPAKEVVERVLAEGLGSGAEALEEGVAVAGRSRLRLRDGGRARGRRRKAELGIGRRGERVEGEHAGSLAFDVVGGAFREGLEGGSREGPGGRLEHVGERGVEEPRGRRAPPEGVKEGARDGASDGLRDGTSDGLRDGTSDGVRDGASDGLRDGTSDGIRDGSIDGRSDGIGAGSLDASMVAGAAAEGRLRSRRAAARSTTAFVRESRRVKRSVSPPRPSCASGL